MRINESCRFQILGETSETELKITAQNGEFSLVHLDPSFICRVKLKSSRSNSPAAAGLYQKSLMRHRHTIII